MKRQKLETEKTQVYAQKPRLKMPFKNSISVHCMTDYRGNFSSATPGEGERHRLRYMAKHMLSPLNPNPHVNGRIYLHLLRSPVAGKGTKRKNLGIRGKFFCKQIPLTMYPQKSNYMPDLDLGPSQTLKEYGQKHLLPRHLSEGSICIVRCQCSRQDP